MSSMADLARQLAETKLELADTKSELADVKLERTHYKNKSKSRKLIIRDLKVDAEDAKELRGVIDHDDSDATHVPDYNDDDTYDAREEEEQEEHEDVAMNNEPYDVTKDKYYDVDNDEYHPLWIKSEAKHVVKDAELSRAKHEFFELDSKCFGLERALTAAEQTIKSRDESLKSRDETIKSLEDTVRSQDDSIKSLGDAVKSRDETIKERDETIAKLAADSLRSKAQPNGHKRTLAESSIEPREVLEKKKKPRHGYRQTLEIRPKEIKETKETEGGVSEKRGEDDQA
ncbi:uncharacterized protein J4E92_008221 [Alternaria infectoria]|uniref:uncharacterized protein n=1 Tax=Alternaria infectoria TaxID=45303 RepID=UPI00221E4D8B|nr:uncharacterized protein J4E92_008221 [Alternaria infectoria]KAI4921232.1 hypothetical protein J4E92_008221 [Alternaria infectoria]